MKQSEWAAVLLLFAFGQAAVGMHFLENKFFEGGEQDAKLTSEELFGQNDAKWGVCGRYVAKNLDSAGCHFPRHSFWKRLLHTP
jgi:hypothetical protein